MGSLASSPMGFSFGLNRFTSVLLSYPDLPARKLLLQLAAPTSRFVVAAGWQHGHGDVGRDCGQWIYRLRVRAAPGPPTAENRYRHHDHLAGRLHALHAAAAGRGR